MTYRQHSDAFLGVPALKCSAVGLSAASPHSLVPRSLAGFPLLSLTRISVNKMILFLVQLLIVCSSDVRPASAQNESRQYRIIPGGDWSGYDHTYFCPSYKFSDTVRNTARWSILNDNALSIVRNDHIKAFEAINTYLSSRAGDHLDKLIFEDVEITYLDSIAQFSHRGPPIQLDKCGRTKYFFRYRFTPFDGVDYRIGIALNDSLEIVSDHSFPKQTSHIDHWKLISPDSAVKVVTKRYSSLRVGEVQLEYDVKKNCFQWRVDEELPEIERSGIVSTRSVAVNANTGRIMRSESLVTEFVD